MRCKQCEGRASFGSLQLGGDKTVLEQIHVKTPSYRSEWTLTSGFSGRGDPLFLRLRFTLDDNDGDFDCLASVTFEAQPPGSDVFAVLGSDAVVPFFFTRASRDPGWGDLDRCVCGFPQRYRNEFVQMVAQLGEIRCLALFG